MSRILSTSHCPFNRMLRMQYKKLVQYNNYILTSIIILTIAIIAITDEIKALGM